MKARVFVLFSIVTASYFATFLAQDATYRQANLRLRPPLPSPFYELGGPFKHLLGDILLIKAKVFLGGRASDTNPLTYALNLERHYSVITQLHPKLLDTYYLCESSLPWISRFFAERSNKVLSAGLDARADHWTIPFFIGFNYFRYLQKNDASVHFLTMASEKPQAPEWVGFLAKLLSTDGGDIVAGFLFLREMKNRAVDPQLRSRLDKDIVEYQKALIVLRGIASFTKARGRKPRSINELIPDFLNALPKMGNGYKLEYSNQRLHLYKNSAENINALQ